MQNTHTETGGVDLSARRSEIVEQLKLELEAMVEGCQSEISTLQAEAEERVERYEVVVEELADSRRELAAFREEHRRLPVRAYESNMRGDHLKEEELRGRYLELEEKIPQLEERIEELRAEADGLCSGSNRALPAVGVYLEANAPAIRKASRSRDEFEGLRDDVTKLLEEAIRPVIDRQKQMVALSSSKSEQVSQEMRQYRNLSELPGH